jgi:A/G-specific adenine glycosylase
MTREKRANSLKSKGFSSAIRALGAWFENSSRILPWRETPSPYRVWISEIMLQQTQVVTVVPYFERFLSRFPDVESLARASIDDVLLHWAGLGYYSRARNVHAAAKTVVARGGFPTKRDDWLELPGVGPYTAGAISSIAFDQVEAILDGNVERVLSRWLLMDRKEGDSAYKAELWEHSRASVELAARLGVRPRVFNQALMELGAVVCTPRSPKCTICPVALACEARAQERWTEFPPAKAPKKWLEVRESMVALLDSSGERVLLRKRGPGEWRAGLWDFPAATDIQSAGLANRPGREILGDIETRHVVTRHKISRTTTVARLKAALPISEGYIWVERNDPQVALGSAPRKVLKLLIERWF